MRIVKDIRNILIFTKKLCNRVYKSPYAKLIRLDKPYGYILPLLPTLWVVVLCAPNISSMLWFSLLFTVGAVVARSAGCIINDLVDQQMDRLVTRTMQRPLVSGEISKQQAVKLLLILFLIACCILSALPLSAIYVALFSVVLIVAYPFTKRFTYYPQVFLGFTFNIGVLIAWTTFHNYKPMLVPLLIYFASILWTTGYDTIYAYQDINDDVKYNIKSMAVKFAEHGTKVVWRLYQVAILTLCIVGLNAHMNLLFFLFMAIAAYQLYWQVESLDIKDAYDCAKKFSSNIDFGLLVLFGTIVGQL